MALSEVEGNANVTFINVVNTVTEDAYEKVNGEIAGRSPGEFFTRARASLPKDWLSYQQVMDQRR